MERGARLNGGWRLPPRAPLKYFVTAADSPFNDSHGPL